VGIVHLSKNEISVAADSIAIRKGRNRNPDIITFDACKVAAFGNNLVFVDAGTAGFIEMPHVQGWDNIEEARAAYRSVLSKNSTIRGHVEDVLGEWARDITNRFNDMGTRYPDQFQAAVNPQGTLVDAFFGGEGSDGTLVLYGVSIHPTSHGSTVATADGGQKGCPYDSFCAVGRGDNMIEFAAGRTERARRENSSWHSAGPYSNDSFEYSMSRAIHMVELTIQYQGAGVNEVGGPIDAVQLRRIGGTVQAKWYTRKKNCGQ